MCAISFTRSVLRQSLVPMDLFARSREKMFSAEESSSSGCKRMNYYVPLQQDAATLHENKKKKFDENQSFFDDKRAVNWSQRILSRRYALTSTGYKFLEIGINVGPPSYVEIAIGDHRGNELILSLETWKGLYEERWNIQHLLRNGRRDAAMTVGPLTIRATQINSAKFVRLESLNVHLTMAESTLMFMLTLDRCVDVTFDSLSKIIDTVDTKFGQFSLAASSLTDSTYISDAIRASNAFDKDYIVDCELLALIFSM